VNRTVSVVVVDDERPLVDLVSRYLRREGYEVHAAYDGDEAIEVIAKVGPDVVVLDLMLPGIDGLEVARRVREDGDPYIVMLTARSDEVDRIVGLRVGADDYVTKPFSPRELVLRVQSVLRRSAVPPVSTGSLTDGDLLVDLGRRLVRKAGRELSLTVREFDLLVHLMRNPGQVFRRAQLLDSVWRWSFGDHSTVTVHVRRLREKIEDDPANPRRIVTVWGVGYRYDGVIGAS
jgi:DNA-binding response OmpR family regulator